MINLGLAGFGSCFEVPPTRTYMSSAAFFDLALFSQVLDHIMLVFIPVRHYPVYFCDGVSVCLILPKVNLPPFWAPPSLSFLLCSFPQGLVWSPTFPATLFPLGVSLTPEDFVTLQ